MRRITCISLTGFLALGLALPALAQTMPAEPALSADPLATKLRLMEEQLKALGNEVKQLR